jgi:transposase-like protein
MRNAQSAFYGRADGAIIREADREPVSAVAKRHGISEQTIYTWRKRFGAYAVRILTGANSTDLPVVRSITFEFVI